MKLSLGFSPCPNDTFIFDALVNGQIDTGGLQFETHLEDIQTLNAWAAKGKLAITKLSFPAFFPLVSKYSMLQSGAALGKGVGPLLVARSGADIRAVEECTIAIPGESTTANFLLSYAFPAATDKVSMLFSSIEDAVCNGTTDLGVIIHENRFTYQQKGLYKVCDLGEMWENREKAPLPLAGIAIKSALPLDVKRKVEKLIRQSVTYNFEQYPRLSTYITSHAQAMEEDVMRKHIELYVNNYSVDLGPEGKRAIQTFYDVYARTNRTQASIDNIFLH